MKNKQEIFEKIAMDLAQLGLRIDKFDFERPWVGFFVIDESQTKLFIQEFFPEYSIDDFSGFTKLSPKILVVAPDKRLSWQYHFRRAEIWRVIDGNVAVATSDDDEQRQITNLEIGDKIILKQGERHRLIGLDGYGVVAEIWQHTDAEKPSDEDDIVRLQDDFGR
jgi:mannose-6-phosphate isomerase